MEDSADQSITEDSVTQPEVSRAPRPPMTASVACGLLAWTALADWLIYRSEGFAGPAAFFVSAPILFLLPLRPASAASAGAFVARGVCLVLLAGAALRLIVLGNAWVFLSGVLATFGVALASSRSIPWALETGALFLRSPLDGLVWFGTHRLPSFATRRQAQLGQSGTANWLLPLATTCVFGGLFVLANPDLVEWVSLRLSESADWAWSWLGKLSAWEAPFCFLALLVGAGLLHPLYGKMRIGGEDAVVSNATGHEAPLYVPIRNTLFSLVLLFTGYLVFEFWSLWKREFPPQFYYAGYAHQGAAWLTVALALATGLLSMIFHGETLKDPRIGVLKRFAGVWSVLNFLLAVAVYNRLSIYVGYNGLTPMRIVGYFGITAVVAGFALVVLKVRQNRGFWWLMRTQLTALLLTAVLFVLFPVDYVAHTYNTSRVTAGYLHPSVMIAVKPMDDMGYLAALGLVECDDAIIRDGVRAMMAERQLGIEAETEERPWHWTRFQAATDELYESMAKREAAWADYRVNKRLRRAKIEQFKGYAMQWY